MHILFIISTKRRIGIFYGGWGWDVWGWGWREGWMDGWWNIWEVGENYLSGN
jgi:hypothetical protein